MPRVNLNQKKLESLKPQAVRVDYLDRILKGFGVRVTPSGEKVFCIMYRIGGKQRRKTLGESAVLKLADARDRARVDLELVRRGIDPSEESLGPALVMHLLEAGEGTYFGHLATAPPR